MTLDKDDLKSLGELLESKIDAKLGKNLEKVGEVVDDRLDMRLGKNLEKVGELIDNKNYNFLHETITPMLDNLFETQRKELRVAEDQLSSRIDNLESSNVRIERKLDQVTDMLAVKVTDHERRISKIEIAIA